MAKPPEGEPRDAKYLDQDPFVERVRPDPSQPAVPTRALVGFLGNSNREGYRRLYFSHELDYYAEFRTEDVIYREKTSIDELPDLELEASVVAIRKDATIEYTWVSTPSSLDEFDLDLRLDAMVRATADDRAARFVPEPTETRKCPTNFAQCPTNINKCPRTNERPRCF